MTEEKRQLFVDLKEKVFQLLTISKRDKEENASLKEKNSELQGIIDKKEADYKALLRNYENLKTAVALMDATDVHAAKIKFNNLLRDIDKCLALLNEE